MASWVNIVVSSYAPTSKSGENKIETFYNDLKEALRHIKKNEITLLLGDFNAKVGKGVDENIVGNYGLETRNGRGERQVQFSRELQFPHHE